MNNKFKNVSVVNHPLCCHNLSIIRDKNTTAEVFRNAIRRITYLLFYKATEDLELETVKIETPLETCEARKLKADKEIIIAPILRAGLIFSDIANEIMPYATVRHIGICLSDKLKVISLLMLQQYFFQYILLCQKP